MKRFSWEIVLAGLLFVFVAIYLMGRTSPDSSYEREVRATQMQEPPEPPKPPTNVQVIDLQNLKELEELKHLSELEQLNQLDRVETLQSLKEVAHLLPSETRDEFLTELDQAIRELSNDEVKIDINLDDNIIVLNRDVDVQEGSWTLTSPGVYTYLSTFDASEINSASINLPTGNITIIGTRDSTARFSVEASGQIDNDDQLSKKLVAQSVLDGNEVTLAVSASDNFYQQNIQLQATIYVPENIEVSGTTKAGHIEITNLHGDQTFETGGGHIKLKKVHGDIVAVTRGGHMWLEDGSGELTFNSTGGHLSVNKFSGEVSLKTAGGNIEINDVDGEITCATSGGNIGIDLKKAEYDITAETSAGNIQIAIPSSTSAEIDLKGSTGVEVNGLTLSDALKTKTRVKGVINDGRSDIIAFTKYGNVLLKSND
jgi:hypothetical protein